MIHFAPAFEDSGAGPAAQATTNYWRVLDDLTEARQAFGLLPATITVLRALMTFLPTDARDSTGEAIVWPSNEVLCQRAAGMDERTLRRHLARLVDQGLIRRHSSANGKRFALRIRRQVIEAYGFDLSPLFHRREEIAIAVDDLREKAEVIHALRSRIRALVHQMGGLQLQTDDTDWQSKRHTILLLLRRTPDLPALRETFLQLSATCAESLQESDGMTGTNGQNDRHLQNTDKDTDLCSPDPEHQVTDQPTVPSMTHPNIEQCLDAISESLAFATEPVRDWQDINRLAQTLGPMIGIPTALAQEVSERMGTIPAALTTLCLVQMSARLRSPAAYLRKLGQLAQNGRYSLAATLQNAARFKPMNMPA